MTQIIKGSSLTLLLDVCLQELNKKIQMDDSIDITISVLHSILSILKTYVTADLYTIRVYDDAKKQFTKHLHLHSPEYEAKISANDNSFDKKINQYVVENKKPLFIGDIKTDKNFRIDEDNIINLKSFYFFPMLEEDQLVGTISFAMLHTHGMKKNLKDSLPILATEAALVIKYTNIYSVITKNSLVDVLTGLSNRNYIKKRLYQEIKRINRNKKSELCIALVQVDNFKTIIEKYNKLLAYKLIKQSAIYLEEEFRDIDIIARFCESIFCIVLLDCPLKHGIKKIENIVSKIAMQNFFIKSNPVSLTVSAGLAHCPSESNDLDDLFMIADENLKIALSNGGNEVYANL